LNLATECAGLTNLFGGITRHGTCSWGAFKKWHFDLVYWSCGIIWMSFTSLNVFEHLSLVQIWFSTLTPCFFFAGGTNHRFVLI
jgi:hypothetical protein